MTCKVTKNLKKQVNRPLIFNKTCWKTVPSDTKIAGPENQSCNFIFLRQSLRGGLFPNDPSLCGYENPVFPGAELYGQLCVCAREVVAFT